MSNGPLAIRGLLWRFNTNVNDIRYIQFQNNVRQTLNITYPILLVLLVVSFPCSL